MKIQGRVAIVTGGGSGIGRAICLGLAQEGADIAVVDIDEYRAAKVADEVQALGRKALDIQADIGCSDPVERMVTQVLDAFGEINILINNAGILRSHLVVEMPEEEWDEVLRTNLKSVFLCSRAVARHMIKQGKGGRIINVSSIHAVLSEPKAGHYTASKGGMEAFSRTLASELARYKITVNCIEPGATWTPMNISVYSESVIKALMQRVPLQELAQPEWIAAGAVFLASEDARYIIGSVITIDGGYTMDGSLPGLAYT